jgi:hypothetical protein
VTQETKAYSLLTAVGLTMILPGSLVAQQWNAPAVMTLVERGVDRRTKAQSDSSLQSYRARAHGFVFFLAQVGEGLSEPPRLVKADELEVEVYWRAPGLSKQVILGWRDGRWLPTDINYHRDHLGIVTNNFGDRIRIGDGDEVRDAVHPLSPDGLTRYDFALSDSLTIRSAVGDLKLYEVLVRPHSYREALVVGRLYLDAATAELVRFRFSFTPAAYLDRALEDITVALENSLFEDRYWLPYRQEIEIRRRTTWLDFPARGIIRGRWEIGGYQFNVPLPPEVFAGAPVGGLLEPVDTGGTWTQPLSEAVGKVAPLVNEQDLEALRADVERIAGAHILSGLSASRVGVSSLSDVIHVNRVQGLTLGIGGTIGLGARRIAFRPSIAFGTSDHRVTGGAQLTFGGATQLRLSAARRIRDFSDLPVITPALNTLLSQEAGKDYGDYVLLESATAGLRHRLSGRSTIGFELGLEHSASVSVAATPANGTYRPNPPLGAGSFRVARLTFERASGGIAVRHDLQGSLNLEAAEGPRGFVRAAGEGRWLAPAGPGQLLARAYVGWGSDGLPAYRSFVLGGRGTLPGEPFRRFGGRTALLGHVEWRLDVPFPAIPLGPYVSSGRTVTLAPFVAAGWTKRPLAGTPWRGTAGLRPVAGLAAEWFMRLIRVEAGVSLRTGEFGLTVDISRDWWGIL